jgi:DNA-directed RNA polymerase subunit RPC12/RpoP
MKKKLIKCPYCGSASGVCNEFKVCGIEYYNFNGLFNGEEITGPYEHTKYVERIDCGKRIMTYEKFAENYI